MRRLAELSLERFRRNRSTSRDAGVDALCRLAFHHAISVCVVAMAGTRSMLRLCSRPEAW